MWLCNRSHLNFLIYEENFFFFFINVIPVRGRGFGVYSINKTGCRREMSITSAMPQIKTEAAQHLLKTIPCLKLLYTARTCTAILCNSWGETFAAKVPALSTVCTTFPKLARNIIIQWPHTWLTTIYRRSWAALRGWDPPPPPPYDRSSVFSDPCSFMTTSSGS